MRYFLFSSLMLMISACSNYFKSLQPVVADQTCIKNIKPTGINTSWYDASVDVAGKYLSGLMLIKEMPDSSVRIVFTNEPGLKFFDFEFTGGKTFNVKHIIPQLNKKAVIKTLQQDFALLLGLPFADQLQAWKRNDEFYYGVKQKSSIKYFVTDDDCTRVIRVEEASKSKRMLSITMDGKQPASPEHIEITHLTFNMVIKLKKIQKDVN